MKIKKIFGWGVLLSAAFISVQLQAQQDAIKFTNQAFKEIEVTSSKGEKEFKLVEPATVLPRDEIIYIITFKNVSDQTVSKIKITDPIPNNSVYKNGTAFGAGTDINFSVDNGKTYAEPNQLKIKIESGGERIATPDDYTQIRWIYTDALQPESEGTVTFRTIIK